FCAGRGGAPARRHHHPGVRAGGGPDGPAAAGHDPHRPDPGLAAHAAAGRAQPFPHQCAARPAPSRDRRADPRGAGPDRAVADGARPPHRHQRQAGGAGRLRGAARQAPGGPRIQPVLWRADAVVQPHRAGPLAQAGLGRGVAGVGSGQDAGHQAGRQDDLRRGRPAVRGGRVQHPAGGLGYDARQFFRHPDARNPGRHAAKLDHVLLPAAGKGPGAACAGAAVPEPDGVRRGRHPATVAVGAQRGRPRGAVAVPVHPGGRRAGAVGRPDRHPRRAHARSRGAARAGRHPAPAGALAAHRAVGGGRPGRPAGRGRRQRDRLGFINPGVRFHDYPQPLALAGGGRRGYARRLGRWRAGVARRAAHPAAGHPERNL
ncbi:LOW QUALITY PROTEIN: hypothetical protein HMPREF0005_05829, partial [Achromobacter xylosoxidans C54]